MVKHSVPSKALSFYEAFGEAYDYIENLTGKSQRIIQPRNWGQDFRRMIIFPPGVVPKENLSNTLGAGLDALALASLGPPSGYHLYQTQAKHIKEYAGVPKNQAEPDGYLDTPNLFRASLDIKRPLVNSQGIEAYSRKGGNIIFLDSLESNQRCLDNYMIYINQLWERGIINSLDRARIETSVAGLRAHCGEWSLVWETLLRDINQGIYLKVPIPSLVKKGPWDGGLLKESYQEDFYRYQKFYARLKAQSHQEVTLAVAKSTDQWTKPPTSEPLTQALKCIQDWFPQW